jgi:hypothetical protein
LFRKEFESADIGSSVTETFEDHKVPVSEFIEELSDEDYKLAQLVKWSGPMSIGGFGVHLSEYNKAPSSTNLNKMNNELDNEIEAETKELIKNLDDVESSTLSITDKEAIKQYYIKKSLSDINTFSQVKLSKKDLKSRVEKILKNAGSLEKMSYFEFFEFYDNYFDNQYSEQFKTLDLSNSVGVRELGVDIAKKYPNSQDKLLKKYHELSRKATKLEEVPYIIYALINTKRPQDSVRTGYTSRLPSHRKSSYKAESSDPNLQYNPLYREMRTQGIDSFKMIILDVQIGIKNAKVSENFFTIYFNRDITAEYGVDLSKNRKYNRIVGDVGDMSGDDHVSFIQGIYFDDLNSRIEYGYDLMDLAVVYGVAPSTIESRIRSFYADKFGIDVGYNEIATYLRGKKLIDLYAQGFNVWEIALHFNKFDIKGNKEELWSNIEDITKAREQYIKGNILETSYSAQTIRLWTQESLGMRSAAAYEMYFVKPIAISLLQCGFSQSKALGLLEAMGITNPYKKGVPYSSKTLDIMLKDRLWDKEGKSWTKMRDIFIEPVIENLIRNNKKAVEVDRLLGLSEQFSYRYIKRVWHFNNYREALIFFQSNYLGRHKVVDFL